MDQSILRHTNFSVFDWVIVIVYPFLSVFLGLYVRKIVRNVEQFVAAGQGLGVCLGIATMTGTELGLITVMYSAQKGFTGGFASFHIALAAGIVTLFVGVTGLIVYRLRHLRVLTIPEFYEKRFGPKTRILGGIMMALGGILNMGLFLKVGSMFLVGITGMSATGWALPTVMTLLIGLVVLYTCLGGMVSVVVADYVQFVVLSFGLLAGTYLAMRHHGWENIVQTIEQTMGRKGFDPTIAESGFGWEYIVWMCFIGLISCAIWPTAVARALAMKSAQAVKRQYMFASVSYLIRFLIPYFWGICAFVFIVKSETFRQLFFPAGYPPPEHLPEGVHALENLYAMPVFLAHLLPAGLIGVVTASMVAAFMSTHDSYLLCWATVLTQDVVAPIYERNGRRLTSRQRILLSRIFIVLIGAYVLAWGLIYKGREDIWDYMAVTGAIYSAGALAVLLGGLYWSRTSSTGAVLALLAGISAVLGLEPVQSLIGISIPSARVGLFSIASTVGALVLGSLLFPDKKPGQVPKPAERLPVSTLVGLVVGAVAILAGLVWVAHHDLWKQLWTGVLALGVGVFGVMAVVVTVGGFLDIGRLFRLLREQPSAD